MHLLDVANIVLYCSLTEVAYSNIKNESSKHKSNRRNDKKNKQ